MLVNWTGADIAGIVAAVVSVGGAAVSYIDRKKAESAADRATRAQEAMSHSARIQDARAARVLCVEYDGNRKLTVTNPFEYQIERIDLMSAYFVNLTITIRHLSPLETKNLQLEELNMLDRDRSIGSVQITWEDQDGNPKTQYWNFTS